MKPNRVAQAVALILAIAGLSALLAAGLIATRHYTVTVRGKHFKCGSVLAPKDPRNKVSNRVQLPRNYQRAYRLCTNTSSDRIQTATKFLVIGVIPLLIVLMLPSLTRRSRRSRRRMGL
jgi:hypothetical protein